MHLLQRSTDVFSRISSLPMSPNFSVGKGVNGVREPFTPIVILILTSSSLPTDLSSAVVSILASQISQMSVSTFIIIRVSCLRLSYLLSLLSSFSFHLDSRQTP